MSPAISAAFAIKSKGQEAMYPVCLSQLGPRQQGTIHTLTLGKTAILTGVGSLAIIQALRVLGNADAVFARFQAWKAAST